MIEQLLRLLRTETAGDPMGGLLWTYRSLAKLAAELSRCGSSVSPATVGKWLKSLGYSLHVNRKSLSAASPPGRDDQFQRIAALRQHCRDKGIPILSVDTKKKELVGRFRNAGATWGTSPEEVNDHDFRSQAKGLAVPYGLYDLLANRGTVFVGDSKDTPAFAVDCLEHWCRTEGLERYPDSDRIVILADCGGSNGYRCRAWKYFLQTKLCDRHGLRVTVAHYPSGSSKWNPIEHRLFSAISRNWAGRPLETWETVLNYIRTTTTKTGLRVQSVRVKQQYRTGVKISDRQMAELNITKGNKLPDWNYDIRPRQPHQPPAAT